MVFKRLIFSKMSTMMIAVFVMFAAMSTGSGKTVASEFLSVPTRIVAMPKAAQSVAGEGEGGFQILQIKSVGSENAKIKKLQIRLDKNQKEMAELQKNVLLKSEKSEKEIVRMGKLKTKQLQIQSDIGRVMEQINNKQLLIKNKAMSRIRHLEEKMHKISKKRNDLVHAMNESQKLTKLNMKMKTMMAELRELRSAVGNNIDVNGGPDDDADRLVDTPSRSENSDKNEKPQSEETSKMKKLITDQKKMMMKKSKLESRLQNEESEEGKETIRRKMQKTEKKIAEIQSRMVALEDDSQKGNDNEKRMKFLRVHIGKMMSKMAKLETQMEDKPAKAKSIQESMKKLQSHLSESNQELSRLEGQQPTIPRTSTQPPSPLVGVAKTTQQAAFINEAPTPKPPQQAAFTDEALTPKPPAINEVTTDQPATAEDVN